MKQYIFETTATMKEYNNKQWWIDPDIIKDIRVKASNISEALIEYRRRVQDNTYITISDNAIRNKSNMYVDNINGEAEQVGYVITGSTDFQKDNYTWVTQYIDLWITIITVVPTVFEEV